MPRAGTLVREANQETIVSNRDPAEVEHRLARLEQQEQRLVQALELLAGREPVVAGKPRRDWDALAAVIASFIGLLALAVSGYTAYVQRAQLRAQVWPHLVIESSNVDPETAWHVTNHGTGPARLTAVRVMVDGAPMTSWDDVLRVAGYPDGGGLILSSIRQLVLPAGQRIPFVRPNQREQDRARFNSLLPGGKHRLDITMCYCSVLDDCWIASSRDLVLDGRPITIEGCPISVAERFVD